MVKYTQTVRISTKGQVVIPAALRKKCGLRAPRRALVMERDGRLIILPLPDDPVTGARGLLKGGRPLGEEHTSYKEQERRLGAEHEHHLP